MTKEVLVHISGLHLEAGKPAAEETEAIEVVVPGTYYLKNGKQYILYEELEEDGRVTKNQMKIYEDRHMEIRKSGVLNAHLIFEIGKTHPTTYQTPFGPLPVAIETRELTIEEQEERISVEIDYGLEVQEEPLADCRIEIRITARPE